MTEKSDKLSLKQQAYFLAGLTCLGSFLNQISFADFSAYVIIVPAALLIFLFIIVWGSVIWRQLTKIDKVVTAIFMIVGLVQLPDLLIRRMPSLAGGIPFHEDEHQKLNSEAFVARNEKNYARAEQIYREIIVKEKSGWFEPQKHDETELSLAKMLFKEGKLQESKEIYENALGKSSLRLMEDVYLLNELGDIYRAMNENARAIVVYKHAIKICEDLSKKQPSSSNYCAQKADEIRKKISD